MSNVVTIDHDPQEPPRSTALTPLAMLDNAIARGADPTTMERLMGLYERWEAGQARKAFDAAVAEAKGEIPPIIKNEVVDFTNKAGQRTNYKFESLATIANVVDPILHKHGLMYRFRTQQEGNRLRVTCILSHRDGHSEETSLESSEDHSGNKNPIQAIGSAATYLQRYTLKLALGLSTSTDDDARAVSNKAEPRQVAADDFITDAQYGEICDLLHATQANVESFLKVYGIESVGDLKASQFKDALGALKRKQAAQEARAKEAGQ